MASLKVDNYKKSGEYCCAINCTNSRYKNPGLSFYRFPKDPERCKTWIVNCRRQDLLKIKIDKISGKRTLCEDHFEASQFMNPALKGIPSKHKHLIMSAVPTCFDISNVSRSATLKRKLSTKTISLVEPVKEVDSPGDKSNSGHDISVHMLPVTVEEVTKTNKLATIVANTESWIKETIKPSLSLLKPINSVQVHLPSKSARTISELRRLLRTKRATIFRLRQKLAKMKQVSESADKLVAKTRVMQLLESVKDNFDNDLYHLIKAQFITKLFKKKKNWSEDELCLPLAIYRTSGKVYRLLSKTMSLPSTRTVQRYLSRKFADSFSGKCPDETPSISVDAIAYITVTNATHIVGDEIRYISDVETVHASEDDVVDVSVSETPSDSVKK